MEYINHTESFCTIFRITGKKYFEARALSFHWLMRNRFATFSLTRNDIGSIDKIKNIENCFVKNIFKIFKIGQKK